MLRASYPLINLLWMGHPVAQLVHGWLVVGEQVSEDCSRVIEEELLLCGLFREKTICYWSRLRLIISLIPDRPIRASVVFGVKNQVAPAFVIKLLEIFTLGIEHNGGFAPFFHLVEDVSNERGLTRAGIARNLDVLGFLGPP